jgi:hypothetical protein
MTEHSITKIVPTDVATILLFHPDELEHTSDWPVGWYSVGPAWRTESTAGRLVAWNTGNDGGFKVRLTTGELTTREQAYVRQSWVFGYTVRLGRVFLDNSDTLPGESRMTEPDENPDYWFELANGDYNVSVAALEWNAEPGSDDDGFDTLPNYVVRFALRGETAAPAVARRPPDLTGDADMAATDDIASYSAPHPYAERDEADFSRAFPAAICAGVRETGGSFSSQGEADFELAILGSGEHERSFEMFDESYVLGDRIAVGEVAQFCRMHGCGGAPGMAQKYSFKSLGPVRIVSVSGSFGEAPPPARSGLLGRVFGGKATPTKPTHNVLSVLVEPINRGGDGVALADLDAYRGEVLAALAEGRPLAVAVGGIANYEALFVAEMDSASELSAFLLSHLPMSSRERLAMELQPDEECAKNLRGQLATLR